MFSWLFPPSCPCDPAAKAWVEERLGWLADEWERSAFTVLDVITPTPRYFPDPYDGSKEAARRLLDRVCEYMHVSRDLVALKFMTPSPQLGLVNENNQAIAGTAGLYEESYGKFIIRVSMDELVYPMSLVGTMAHELAHAKLLGENRIRREVYDNELLTDLTTVHFGMGIFLANRPRHWDSDYSKWPGTELRKPEYMSAPMYGWALAHIALWQGDDKPGWARHLSSSAKANFKQGVRYLKATGDTQYKPSRR